MSVVSHISIIKLFALTLVLSAVSACNHQRAPENLLPEDVMVDVLYESYLFEGYSAITTDYDYRQLAAETKSYYDDLFKKHDITQEQYDASVDYYMRNRMLFEGIYNQVISRLDSLTNTMQ